MISPVIVAPLLAISELDKVTDEANIDAALTVKLSEASSPIVVLPPIDISLTVTAPVNTGLAIVLLDNV